MLRGLIPVISVLGFVNFLFIYHEFVNIIKVSNIDQINLQSNLFINKHFNCTHQKTKHVHTLCAFNAHYATDFNQTKIPILSHPNLPRALNATDLSRLYDLISAIDGIFKENNITYVMSYGTLLGSYFMHGVLPWDDDLDIMVKASDFHKIDQCNFTSAKNRNKNIQSYHDMTYSAKWPKVKLFFEFDKRIRQYKWAWPFCDVRTFKENETHVWIAQNPEINSDRVDFYPLHNRPLGKLWMPVARKPQIWLKNKYGDFHCGSSPYNHRVELYNRHDHGIYEVPCESLHEYYPFVHRRVYAGGVLETLTLNNSNLYTVWLDEPHGQTWDFL